MDRKTINVQGIINSPFCVDVTDGEKIYDLLYRSIQEKQYINLSFKGIELVITAFLNVAIGKLYKDFDDKTIKEYLIKSDLDQSFESCWNKVILGAPKYYANKEALDKSIEKIIED